LGEDLGEYLGEVLGEGFPEELGEELGVVLGEVLGEGFPQESGEELGEGLGEESLQELGEVFPHRGCRLGVTTTSQLMLMDLRERAGDWA